VIRSGNPDRSAHKYMNTILTIMLVSVLLLVTSTSNRSVYATHLGTSSDVWGIEAAIIAKIHHFDPSTDTTTPISRVPTLSMENGRGMASDGTNLWYTILIKGFHGDGKIHKIGPNGGPDMVTIPDPFGFNGSGIDALDFDSAGYLWAISSYPIQLATDPDPKAKIVKIDSNTGSVLSSCDIIFRGSGPTGTFAIVNGKILTHGDGQLNHLNEYNPPSGIGGWCVPTGNVFNLPVTAIGIDTDSAGNLLVSDLHSLYNLGSAPYNSILASQPNAFGQFTWEVDITTKPEINDQTSACAKGNVQHWDKIVFMITDPKLATKTNLTANTELDIKVLDDPKKVADLKQKVLNFLGNAKGNKSSIRIIDVDYAIICALPPPNHFVPPHYQANETSPTAAANLTNGSNPLAGMGKDLWNINITSNSKT
jgi:hypothetical protein